MTGRRYSDRSRARPAVPAPRAAGTPEGAYSAAIDQASAEYQAAAFQATAGLREEWRRKISEAAARLAEATREEAA